MLCLRLSTQKKWILLLVAIAFVALTIVTPALADYLGPNRTVTQPGGSCTVVLNECMYVKAKGDYRYHQVNNWVCANESKPWQDYPSKGPACNAGNVGYQYWSREEGQPETVVYPPATIIGSLLNCTLQNGWCITAPQLSLSGSEPVSGYNILALEGTLNGQTFACSGSDCSVSLNEGDNSFTYWALSSWGDTSTMGALSARVDTAPPDLSLDISGASGANGWYISPVTLTPIGSDAVSGLAGASLSIDNGAWQPSVTLNDGVYSVAVTASDLAGNVSNSSTNISIDTTTPSINVSINGTVGKNGWYQSSTQVSAISSDATSGIASFETSTDGGPYQRYNSPVSFSDGNHTIRFKTVDQAGNITETPLQGLNVDTIAPAIELPASWEFDKKVPYTVQDNGSGLASLRLVIEDEDERYTKVAWNETVSGVSFSDDIHWNGKFKDGTTAPPGTYLVWLKASDKAGNESIKLGKVTVPETNVIASLFQANDAPKATPLPPADLAESEDSLLDVTPPVLDFGGSQTESQSQTTTSNSVFLTAGTAASIPDSSPNVLWGAAAAATIGATMAYALAEKRKREEAAIEEALREAEEEERRAKRQAQHMEKLEAQRAQERVWEEAREDYIPNVDMKIARMEFGEVAKPTASPGALQQYNDKRRAEEVQKLVEENRAVRNEISAGLEFIIYPAKPEPEGPKLQDDVYIPPKETESSSRRSNWWEKTKAFISEEIIQPLEPAIEKTKQFISNETIWISENIYEPILKPDIERRKESLLNKIEWIDEKIYEPILKPDIERRKQSLINEIGWGNEKIYQPYLKNVYQPFIAPVMDKFVEKITDGLTWVIEHFYQPLIQPAIERTKQFINDETAWINENVYQPWVKPVVQVIDQEIYQPYIEPVTSDINKYIVQPYIKPEVDEVYAWGKDTWDQYGGWVHNALDILGVIPVVGDWADGVNALIYLSEGRLLEAGISAMSMIPLLGDLGKAGKLGLKVGEEAFEEVAEVAVKEGIEGLLEKGGKEVVEEVSEKAVKEVGEEIAGQAAKETVEEVVEKSVKETGETLIEKTTKIGVNEVEQGIHTTLNMVGRIPGFGEVSNVANSLTYLARGKLFDASVAVMSMVPIVGGLGVTGLQGLKIATEFLEKTIKEAGEELGSKLFKESLEITEETIEEAGEELFEKAAKGTIEEVVEDGVKETGEEIVEKATKETVNEAMETGVKETEEELLGKATKETVEEASQKTVKEISEEASENVAQTTATKTTKEATDEISSKVADEAAAGTPTKANNTLSTKITEDAIADDVRQRREEKPKTIEALREKHGDEAVDKFLAFCKKYDIDANEVLTRPPAEGQTLIGWGLGIADPSNPANHSLVDLNLTQEEINNIVKRSVVRPESKIVVLGFGGGVEKPYFQLSDEIEGCHLSLSNDDWAPFQNAKGNFLTTINIPFVEKGIEERKVFLFNVDYDLLVDPAIVQGFEFVGEVSKGNKVRGKYCP